MSHLMLGVICGLAFGALNVGIMMPMALPNKSDAMSAAFVNRFGIGLLIPLVTLPMPYWAAGLVISLLLSLPAAIITKRYVPILVIGAVGGAVIGYIAGRVGG